ncbi:hypothetical protein [Agrobacterium genomosp. 2]|uniref:Uncharacterized protein n=1 Tax=Agrobacterium genomosp. 2 str. CFBP 5494 TaxID=1183436 RepID=A0A9W5B2N9_9HYPH|nr:hypothetical protein [Agrobacterium genomosp. 2]CUW93599.1 hypothetical protein AGR2A_Cc70053 [Agrobacterium genomosp. 2 str. CFBP 5494]
MDIATDLSDEAMAIKYGHVINEIPELWEALRIHEIKNRPEAIPGGFNMKSNSISVQREGGMLRLRIGNARG